MVKKQPFGQMPDGTPVEIFTLTNGAAWQARITTYGGAVVSLTAPDKAGKYADVVLGMEDLTGYLAKPPFFGALIGRYGNRIGGGMFHLDGQVFTLPKNDPENNPVMHAARRPGGLRQEGLESRRSGERGRPEPRVDLRE